jgi:ribosome recycling factor
MEKASEITEDDLKNGEKELQNITDEFTSEVDNIRDEKEKEVMEI